MDKNQALNHKDEMFNTTRQYFVRLMKEKKIYKLYSNVINQYIKKYYREKGGKYGDSLRSREVIYDNFFNNIFRHACDDFTRNGRNTPYDFITCCVNTLLHDVCEAMMKLNPRVLGAYGQECFNATMMALFDEEDEQMSPEDDFENFCNYLYEMTKAHYIREHHEFNMSFEDFKRSQHDHLVSEYHKYNSSMQDMQNESIFASGYDPNGNEMFYEGDEDRWDEEEWDEDVEEENDDYYDDYNEQPF